MDRVSELVRLKEFLQQAYSLDPINQHLNDLDNKLMSLGMDTTAKSFGNEIQSLCRDLSRIKDHVLFNQTRYQSLIGHLENEISIQSQKFFSDNYDLEIQVEDEVLDIVRFKRLLNIEPETKQEIIDRIGLHTSWQYPGLEISCRDGEFTKYLIASDPLYVVDHYQDFLDNTRSQFNEDYQRRLRTYLVKNHDLSVLPQRQFGFVFSWNYLNYRSLDSIKEYLKSVYNLLRPGGVFFFSYNNGDLHECAGYAESRGQSYMPKSLLVPMAESIGYESYYTRDVRGAQLTVSWIELRKPGQLQTIKAHPSLGELLARRYPQITSGERASENNQ